MVEPKDEARHCVRGRGHGIGMHRATFDGSEDGKKRVGVPNETKTHRLHYFKSELPYSELVTYTGVLRSTRGEVCGSSCGSVSGMCSGLENWEAEDDCNQLSRG